MVSVGSQYGNSGFEGEVCYWAICSS